VSLYRFGEAQKRRAFQRKFIRLIPNTKAMQKIIKALQSQVGSPPVLSNFCAYDFSKPKESTFYARFYLVVPGKLQRNALKFCIKTGPETARKCMRIFHPSLSDALKGIAASG
jgi:hypothetical protein